MSLRLLLQSRRRSNVDLPDQPVCGGDLAQQSGTLPSAQLLGVLHAVPPLFQPGCPALLQQLPFLSNLLQLSARIVQIMPLLNVAPPAARGARARSRPRIPFQKPRLAWSQRRPTRSIPRLSRCAAHGGACPRRAAARRERLAAAAPPTQAAPSRRAPAHSKPSFA